MNLRGPRVLRGEVLAAAWLGVGLVWAVDYWLKRRFFMKGGPIPFGTSLFWCLLFAGAWVLLTPLVVALVRRYPPERPRLGRKLLVQSFAMLLLAALAEVIFSIMALPFAPLPGGAQFLRGIQENFLFDFTTNLQTYFTVAGITWGLDAYRRFREHELRNARLEAEIVKGELQSLKSQLQPHFLFNTLNGIQSLVTTDPDLASRTLVQLGDLLRLALRQHTIQLVTLREEIEFLEIYAEIQKTRFAGRLAIAIEADEAALRAEVPNLVLQPLVENAIRHGALARPGEGHVWIRARIEGRNLLLSVEDDGPGFRRPSSAAGHGVGLANTRARLERLYPGRHRLTLDAGARGGAAALIVLPFDEPREAAPVAA